MEKEITIHLDSTELDKAVEKANRLIELLREVQQLSDSLFVGRKSES